MISLAEYERLVAKVKRLQQLRDETTGALREATKALVSTFKCKNTGQARRLRSKREIGAKKKKRAYQRALAAFQERWGATLEELS